MTEALFHANKAEGAVATYYQSGKLKNKGIYHRGLLEGLWESWYENGNKESEIDFKKGIAVTRKEWDETGNPKTGY